VVVDDEVDDDSSSTDRTELIVLLSTTKDAVIDAHNAGYVVIFPVDMIDVSPLLMNNEVVLLLLFVDDVCFDIDYFDDKDKNEVGVGERKRRE
jgi:hypothetical protein